MISIRLVERGELDLTFVMLPIDQGPFEAAQLLADPYVLVVPARSPLAAEGRATLRELADLPLIGFRQCRSVECAEVDLQARGIQPRTVFRSDHNGTVQGLVAAGVGVALVPLLAVDAGDERVAVIDLAPQLPPRLIGVAWHRDRYRSAAARAFVEVAVAVCAELEDAAAPPASLAG